MLNWSDDNNDLDGIDGVGVVYGGGNTHMDKSGHSGNVRHVGLLRCSIAT